MLDLKRVEVRFECCIASPTRVWKLLWEHLYRRTVWRCAPQSKSSRLEVSHSSEVAVLPAFSSGFCVHFLQRGEYEGWWGACQLFHSPCFCFSLSQYPTFIVFYCGNCIQRGPLAEQIAISMLSMWFGGRPTCLSHISLRDEISPAHRLAGLKFAGQRVHILLSHMRFGGLYQHRWWGSKGAYSALADSPWCSIDQRCWCLDCQAKNDRSCVEMPTFLMNPSATEWKTSAPHASIKYENPIAAWPWSLFHHYLLRSHDLTCEASLDLRRRSIITQSAQQLGKTACFHRNMAAHTELRKRGTTETLGTGVC